MYRIISLIMYHRKEVLILIQTFLFLDKNYLLILLSFF